MIFHENFLLADNSHEISSHEISYLIFYRKLGRMSRNVSSVAVANDALRVMRHTASRNKLFVLNGVS